jgi:hypothetical protein
MTCELCEKGSGIFDLNCQGCRDRIVMRQFCKIARKEIAEDIEARWGFLPNYKRDPHCGCERVCERKSNTRAKNE